MNSSFTALPSLVYNKFVNVVHFTSTAPLGMRRRNWPKEFPVYPSLCYNFLPHSVFFAAASVGKQVLVRGTICSGSGILNLPDEHRNRNVRLLRSPLSQCHLSERPAGPRATSVQISYVCCCTDDGDSSPHVTVAITTWWRPRLTFTCHGYVARLSRLTR